MDAQDLFDMIDDIVIDDEAAADSERGGDSDAEDGKTTVVLPNERRLRASTSKVTFNDRDSNNSSDSDFDSDDSVIDPNFIPEEKNKKLATHIFEPESDDSSCEEEYVTEKIKSSEEKKKKEKSSCTQEETEKNYYFDWKVGIGEEPKTFASFIFSQICGAQIEVDFKSPIAIFTYFFDNTLMEMIVNESNKYAEQCNTVLNLSVPELYAFIGVCIIMGFHKLPSIRMYWCSDVNLRVPRITEIMTLKRFLKILRYIHINDNQNMPKKGEAGYDKLYKIRPLLTDLNAKFGSAFSPSRNLSIDESMVGFKGRSTLKQYMPQKPTKRGFKVWALSCSMTGYLLKFAVYEGRSTATVQEVGSLGERTVLEISEPYAHKGYCLFFDNFFSTVPLLQHLKERNLFACGTFRSNRKYSPKSLFEDIKKMKMGESRYAMADDISFTVWKDRGVKPVLVVSNMHNPEVHTTVQRTNKEGKKETVSCPVSISDYNKYMNGVDRFDQLMQCYTISKKSRRWWMKLFYYLVDASIVNSFILYNHQKTAGGQQTVPQIKFRSILANQLIGTFSSTSTPGRKATEVRRNKMKKKSGRIVTVENSFSFRDVGEHLPQKSTKRRCAFCSTRKNPKRSRISCAKCDVGLCVGCFAEFHKKQ